MAAATNGATNGKDSLTCFQFGQKEAGHLTLAEYMLLAQLCAGIDRCLSNDLLTTWQVACGMQGRGPSLLWQGGKVEATRTHQFYPFLAVCVVCSFEQLVGNCSGPVEELAHMFTSSYSLEAMET